MKSNILILLALCSTLLATSCADKSRRAEIEQRKSALVHKQDSALAEAQHRLAVTDTLLEAAKQAYDRQHEWVMAHSQVLTERSPEVLQLNQLRARRDSLQVEWETLGAKIQYIRKKQGENKR